MTTTTLQSLCHILCPSLTVPDMDECKRFAICTLSSSSKGQIKNIFRWARFFLNKSTNIGRTLLIFHTNDQE